ncbi:MAG: FAD-dependent oxidoreductase [Candidatus Levybacteria bacterium]|nr:FAD-dependent oxidoreductase [Candidatus Levybacteria bacterium]
MKIGIIGAGFTGLSAAFNLQKEGHSVTIFEKDSKPGGLAIGYKETSWDWTLEEHYHHWFTNDKSVLTLAKELSHPVIIKRPKTSSYVDGGIYQLDSPMSLLHFPKLTIIERFRTGISIGLLRYNPFWKILENFTAEPYLKKSMGERSYKKIWEPLMTNKLGRYTKIVSLAWFWARVYKRTPKLAYPEGGFLNFARHLEETIVKNGGTFHYNSNVSKLTSDNKVELIINSKSKITNQKFDKVIVTIPTFAFTKISPQLPKTYVKKYSSLIGIGAMNLVLRLKAPFLTDGTYWLNMCDTKSPILAIVEHTNFMNKKNYNNEHLLYIGNYMETSDPRFSMTDDQLLKLYDPWLKKINPNYQSSVISHQSFHAPFAQPIIPKNYSSKLPPLKTPLKNVYLANIQQVYPWDRGTNYAVELGEKVSKLI